VGWIGLAQDTEKWRAVVNVVMNLWGNYPVATQLVASHTALSSTGLGSCKLNLSVYNRG
jgi:hypothetical protein